MKILTLILMLTALIACSDKGGGGFFESGQENPVETAAWLNLTQVADTYTYQPASATLDEFISFGQVGATADAMCLVLWESASKAYAACRNLTDDGQWPVNCSENADTTVSCSGTSGVALYFAVSLGPPRTITTHEAELADEIRRDTYCTAPRLDGSGSPCVLG